MKAVIFDFNGTMFFDSDKHEKAWERYLGKLIGRKITDEEFKKYVHGRNSSFIIEHFLNKKMDKETLMNMSDEKEGVYRKLCLEDKENFHLVNGLTGFLDYLKEKDINVNIATASNKENIDFYFNNFSLGNWFDYDKVVYDDGTLPGKPEPDIYLKAAENIGIDPGDTIVFEDALSGIKSAFNGGFAKIIVIADKENEFYFRDLKEVSGVIKDFSEAKGYLD
ncbi:HAD family hydrolase [Anaerofustis stercorihominis]|uniref:HAD family hydrolase n=1 Tax=Anaerofustis stercorihominis TaxID=214853 RepID=UPI00214A8E67|nr:HAD family phosphatase [Anaerofustis stercorihominis]MCR2032839.1 HAD family phosphatase [Anaerofustis stercorihominis]